jgi:D-apionolactonase
MEPVPSGPISLRAGPFSMIYDNGDLRYIRLGGKEAIRRIYAAVRDHNWNTIAGQLRNVRIDNGRDFFHVSYECEHHEGEIAFVWRGEINGEPDGTIRFTFDGEARSTFLKNRIGFCVLHPIKECAGEKCRVERVDGSVCQAEFPRLVAAEQPVRDLHDLRAIAHEVEPGVRVEVRFERDIFETEDQRNWIDASFKTFCTPLRLPYPVGIKAGTRIEQSVTVRIQGLREPIVEIREEPPIRLKIDFKKTRPICPIGLGVSSFREKYSTETIDLLRRLNLSHLRVELDFSIDWRPVLDHAVWEAQVLNLPLEFALILSPGDEPDLSVFMDGRIVEHDFIKRFVVLTKDAKSTSGQSFQWVLSRLGSFAPVGAGTNADFYQLNQSRPDVEKAAFVAWSMNPQVHAFDDLSIIETPEAVGAQIESARVYFPGKQLIVSPITLKPRFNPVATGPSNSRTDRLPPEVDPRQRGAFAAAWTLAMIKRLVEAGVDSVTFFETVGWRGLIERDAGSPNTRLFESVPKDAFPACGAFLSLAPFARGELISCTSTSPREIECLALKKDGKTRVIMVNLTATPKRLDSPLVHGMLGAYEYTAWTSESARAERHWNA